MTVFVGIFAVSALELLLFYGLSRDAERHDIYLSRRTRILFLLTFTAPLVIVWYLYKRVQSNRDSQLGKNDNDESGDR